MTATLTLYQIDKELQDLLAYRQDRVEDRDSPASAEELEATDGAIRTYMEQLPRKVDGVASFLRYCDEQVEAADKEIARMKAYKAAVVDNRDRVKDCAAVVLGKQPEGARRLKGNHSTIYLKRNGGIDPLVISQPDLVPYELCYYEGRLSMRCIEILRDNLSEHDRCTVLQEMKRTPSNALVREALIQPCPTCDGRGRDTDSAVESTKPCGECGGSGRTSVPGAQLGERSSRIEVR